MKTTSHARAVSLLSKTGVSGGLLLLLMAGTLASSASAQITITVTGVVSRTSTFNATVPAGIHNGDAVTTTITFATPASSASGVYLFSSSNFSFQTTIGSTTWTSATSYENAVSLTNNAVGGASPGDRFAITTSINGTPATFPGALSSSSGMSLILLDTALSYDLIQGTSLPAGAGDVIFAAATSKDGSIFTTTGPGSTWSITYSINTFSLSAAAVPEPADAGLVCALAAVAVGFWRRRRPTKIQA